MPVKSAMAQPLCDVKDEHGNTALHLLCQGAIQPLLHLIQCAKVPVDIRKEIQQKIEKKKTADVIGMLLEYGCVGSSTNSHGKVPVEELLKNVWAVSPTKYWHIEDYVQILFGLLSAGDSTKKLLEGRAYIKFFKHLVEVEHFPDDDTKSLLIQFRHLEDSALHLMLSHIIQIICTGKWYQNLKLLLKWFDAVLEGATRKNIDHVLLDRNIRQHIQKVFTEGHKPFIKHFLEIRLPDNGERPLHVYVREGAVDMVTLLVTNEHCTTQINARNSLRRSALFYCTSEMVLNSLMKSSHLDVNITDNRGLSVLMWLVERGQFNIATKLLKSFQDIDLNYKEENCKWNILFYFLPALCKTNMSSGAMVLFKALLGYKDPVDIRHVDITGKSALSTILALMHTNMESQDAFRLCADIVLELINHKNVPFDQQDDTCKSAVMYAVSLITQSGPWCDVYKVRDIVVALLARGCDINQIDRHGRTLLIYAIDELKHTNEILQVKLLEEIVNMILQNSSVKVNAKDKDHRTALVHAAMCNNEIIAHCLLNHKDQVDVNVVDKSGYTAAFYAYNLSPEILKMLISEPKHKLNLSAQDTNSKSLFHLAVKDKNMELIKLLLTNKDLDFMLEDCVGDCPVFTAIKSGIPDDLLIEIIMDQRYNIEFHNKDRKCIIEIVMDAGLSESKVKEKIELRLRQTIPQTEWNEEIFDMVKKLEWKINVQDCKGKTGAMYAIQCGPYFTTFSRLISSKNINTQDSEGNSALHYGLKYKTYDMLTVLLMVTTCDIYLKNNEDESPWLLALYTAPADVVRQFTKHPSFDVLHVDKEPDRTALEVFLGEDRCDCEKASILSILVQCLEDKMQRSKWDRKKVDLFLSTCESCLSTIDLSQDSALTYALKNLHMDLALKIMEREDFDINWVVPTSGNSALLMLVKHLAKKSTNDWSSEEEDLLNKILNNLDVNVNLGNDGHTPLLVALEKQHSYLVDRLLFHEGLALSVPNNSPEDKESSAIDDMQPSSVVTPTSSKQSGKGIASSVDVREKHRKGKTNLRRPYSFTDARTLANRQETRVHRSRTFCARSTSSIGSGSDCNISITEIENSNSLIHSVAKRQKISLLEFIIRTANLELFERLINHPNFNVNEIDKDFGKFHTGPSLLHSIVRQKWTAALETLLQQEDLAFDIEEEPKEDQPNGDTPLFIALTSLAPFYVRKMLDHPNCDAGYQNVYRQNALSYLKGKQAEGQKINEKLFSLLDFYTKESERQAMKDEGEPKTPSQLQDQIEQLVFAFKSHQCSKSLSTKEKDDLQFFIGSFIDNVYCVGSSEADMSASVGPRKKYINNYGYLLQHICLDRLLMAYLVQNKILTSDDEDRIMNKLIPQVERNQMLIKMLMQKGVHAYEMFLNALKETGQEHIVEILETSDSEPQSPVLTTQILDQNPAMTQGNLNPPVSVQTQVMFHNTNLPMYQPMPLGCQGTSVSPRMPTHQPVALVHYVPTANDHRRLDPSNFDLQLSQQANFNLHHAHTSQQQPHTFWQGAPANPQYGYPAVLPAYSNDVPAHFQARQFTPFNEDQAVTQAEAPVTHISTLQDVGDVPNADLGSGPLSPAAIQNVSHEMPQTHAHKPQEPNEAYDYEEDALPGYDIPPQP